MEIDLANKSKAEQLQVIKRAATELAYALDTVQRSDGYVSGSVGERMRGLQNAAGDLIQSINSMNEPQPIQSTQDMHEQADRLQEAKDNDAQPRGNPDVRQQVKDMDEEQAESAFERMRDKLQQSVAETGEIPAMEDFIKENLNE